MKLFTPSIGRALARRTLGLCAGLILTALAPARAQTIPLYTLTSASGTYAPLTTGTPFSPSSGGGTNDDGYSTPLTLPFSFQYGTTSFTTVTVNTNGYIGLGTHTVSDNYNIFQNAEDNTIAFANIDLEPAAGGSVYRTVVDGAAPNRIFKIEAANFQRYSGVGGPGKTGSAQVWLFEGSNDIELHYGAFGALWGNDNFQGRFDSVRVGLRGVTTANVAGTTGQWSAPTQLNSRRAAIEMSGPNSNLPANGQVLRFAFPAGQDLTPPVIGPITLTPPAPACQPTAHLVSVRPTDASGIGSVRLSYAVGNAAPTVLTLTNVNGNWEGTIPAQGTALVTWFLTVTDASPQANQSVSAPAFYTDGTLTVEAGANQTLNLGSTATLQATAGPRTALKITEFTLSSISTGATSPPPPYIGLADDFVEISNTGAVAASLNGYQLEVRSTLVGAARTYTFPAAATIPPRGVLVLHLGPGTDQPASNYYHTGGTEAFGSGSDLGLLLLAPGGTTIDAVAVNNFAAATSFPPGTWTGSGVNSPSGIAGASLTGTDSDSNTGWTTASTAARQTLGAYNPGLTDQPLPTVTWSGGVLTGPTTSNPLTTPAHTAPGTYTYTVILDQNGCTVTDQVTVTVVTPVIPVADFAASATSVNSTDIVTFTDLSTNLPADWQWSFTPNTVTYVNGTTETSQNPQVRFNTSGCYTVGLTAANAAGANTRTKPSYVCVTLSYCSANLHGSPCSSFNGQINDVSIAGTTLSNLGSGCTSANGPAYTIFPASGSTTATLTAGQTYALTVQSSSIGSIGAWLDTNANGLFEASEFILVTAVAMPPTPATSTVQFTIPGTSPGGLVGLRIRNSVSSNSISAGDACVTRFTGETEDYYVTVVPLCTVAAPTITSNSPVCAGGTLTLSVPSQPAGTTYAWSGPNGFTSTAVAPTLPNATAAAAGAYSLVITRNGCSSPAATVNVAVNALPAAPTGFTTTRCGPGSVSLTFASIPTGSSYRWYTTATGGTPITGANRTFITPSLTTTTTYYVSVVTTAGGCESPTRALVNAQIDPLPTATLTANGATTLCAGSSVTLTATGGAAGATYVFRRGTTVLTGTTGNSVVVTQAGSYTVTVTDPSTCAATSTAIAVTVNPQASAAFAYASSTLCRTATQNAVPAISGTRGGAFTVAPATGLTLNPTTGAITPSTSTPGTYVVTYTVGTAPCDATQSQTLTITTAPAAGFAYVPTGLVCAGSATTLTPTLDAGASAGTFSATPAGLTLTPGSGAINLATSQPGTYSITNAITASGGCAAATATSTLTVLAAPTATVTASGPTTFCEGGSVTLTASGGATYLWSTGATTPTLSVTTGGSYSVTATNAAGCATASAPLTVTVNPQPTATFAYPAAAICLGSAATADATITGTTGGSFSATPAGVTLNATTGAIDLIASAPGTYTVTYTVAGPCPATTTQTVTLTAAPNVAFTYSSLTGCVGTSGTLQVQAAPDATLGAFSATPAGLTLNATTGNIDLATSQPGTYVVTSSVAAAGGCPAATGNATVTLNALPTAAITNLAATFCANDVPVQLTGTIDGVAGVGTFTINGQPATQFAPAALGAGTFAVVLTGSNAAGCTGTASQTVTVTASPAQPTATAATQASGLVILTSSAPTGNQWYLNGSPIPGATGTTYTVSTSAQNGNYTVVSALGACASAPSAPVNVVVTGLTGDRATALNFSLYPNPTADGQVMLDAPTTAPAGTLMVSVLDGVGREVFRTKLTATTTSHALDLRHLPTGVYSVRLTTDGASAVRRLVRE